MTDYDGWLPIHIACFNGHRDVVQWFVESTKSGPDTVRARSFTGSTPLKYAAKSGNLSLCKYLHSHGAAKDVNVPDNFGVSPMRVAAEEGHAEVAEWLILKGASVALETEFPAHIPSTQTSLVRVLEWCTTELKSHYLFVTNIMCPMHEPFHTATTDAGSDTLSGVTSRHDIEAASGSRGNLSTRASLASHAPYTREQLMNMRVIEVKRIATMYGLDISACKDKVDLADVMLEHWRWPPTNHLCKLRGLSHVRELIASFTGVAMGAEFVSIRKVMAALGGASGDINRQFTIAAGHCVMRSAR